MSRKILKIGEMSSLFGISKQTLHYYDHIDVFKPGYLSESGYRMYYFDQCLELASIIYFKNKGLSLEQIRDIRQNLNPDSYFENMQNQYKFIDDQIMHLKALKNSITRKIEFVEKNMHVPDINKIWSQYKPKRYYYSIGEETILYINDGFYQNPTVIIYENDKRDFGCYLYGESDNPEYKLNGIELKIIPDGNYLCGYHKGPYETILNRVSEMRTSNPHLKLDEPSIHFNIIDQFVESDNSNFLTEINIRIL